MGIYGGIMKNEKVFCPICGKWKKCKIKKREGDCEVCLYNEDVRYLLKHRDKLESG